MKKGNLLASTALVSALAMAGSANALDLRLGGYAEFWTGYADADDEAGTVNRFDVKTDAEIHFRAEEKLDNGLTIGFVAEIEAGPGNDQGSGPPDNLDGDGPQDTEWDEMYAYVKSGFGQFNIGNNDNATGYVPGVRTVGPVGIFKSDAGDWLPGTYALNNTDVDLGFNDSQNITYFTPRVGGLQLIVSYTPDSGEHGTDWVEGSFDRSETGGAHHLWSGAVRFNRKFGEVGVGIAAGYSNAEAADDAAGGSTLEGYTGNLDLTFGPARVTAAYAFEDLAGSREDEHYGGSVLFTVDKINTVSLGYGHGESERGGGREIESDWITAGWNHNMGRGVNFAASVFHAETEDSSDSTADRDGFGVVGGLRLTF